MCIWYGVISFVLWSFFLQYYMHYVYGGGGGTWKGVGFDLLGIAFDFVSSVTSYTVNTDATTPMHM